MRAVYSRKCLITSSLEPCRRALRRYCVLWATLVTPCKPWEPATPTCGRDLHAVCKGFLQGRTWSPVHRLVTSWVGNYSHEVHPQDNCCRQYNSKNWGLCPLAIYKHKYRSWYMKIHAIISKHGFGYIMDHLNETNYCSFLSEFGQRCEDCFVQDWHASLENDLHRKHGGRNKLRTYRRFKHSFEWESYLTYIKSPPLRTALCRFRISCHSLEIERGRYHRPKPLPADQRFCPSCQQLGRKLVEDEVHFLMFCRAYAEERLKLFDVVADFIPSFKYHDPQIQFELLMSCTSRSVVLKLAQFVFVCMKQRQLLCW